MDHPGAQLLYYCIIQDINIESIECSSTFFCMAIESAAPFAHATTLFGVLMLF